MEVGTESMVLLQLERRWDCMGFYGQKADSTWNGTLRERHAEETEQIASRACTNSLNSTTMRWLDVYHKAVDH